MTCNLELVCSSTVWRAAGRHAHTVCMLVGGAAVILFLHMHAGRCSWAADGTHRAAARAPSHLARLAIGALVAALNAGLCRAGGRKPGTLTVQSTRVAPCPTSAGLQPPLTSSRYGSTSVTCAKRPVWPAQRHQCGLHNGCALPSHSPEQSTHTLSFRYVPGVRLQRNTSAAA